MILLLGHIIMKFCYVILRLSPRDCKDCPHVLLVLSRDSLIRWEYCLNRPFDYFVCSRDSLLFSRDSLVYSHDSLVYSHDSLAYSHDSRVRSRNYLLSSLD